MKKNIVLIGGGGHCKSVTEVLESLEYSILGILDIPEKIGEKILSTSVIGTDDDIHKYKDNATFIITVGFIKDPSIRIKLYNKVKNSGGKLETIIAPTAYVSKYATIEEGTIVMHKAFVNAEVKIGRNCIINTFSNIEHESIIGDNCHISTGAMVNGGCIIGDNTFIGSQSVLAHGISVERNSIISAGAFVHKSINSGVYICNPANKIK